MTLRLHRIEFVHCAPKDREDGIKTLVITDDATDIAARVDKTYNYDSWSEDEEPITVYDDDYQEVGEESRMERVRRMRGNTTDDDLDFSDAYYGITLLGWDEGVDITDEDAETLLRLGI